ncbi:hypothetical protein IKQ26_08565 [bacterium]|nr:hypothetical protein [bacterium]
MNLLSRLFNKQYQILMYLPEAVLVIDGKGIIKYANKLAFKIFETQHLIRKNINNYFIMTSDNIIQNSEYGTKQVLKLITENGTTKITDVKVTSISTRKKECYIITIVDNTQDHNLLDRLLAERQENRIIDRTKNGLLVKMKNNLCSPLHSIVGFSQAMLTGMGDNLNEKQEKYMQIINNNSNEVLLFLNKLIELSQVESNLIDYDFKICDVTSLMKSVVGEYSQKFESKGMRLFVDTTELIKINCYTDKNILKSVISSLLDNALLSPNTGTVTVKLSNPENANISDKIEILADSEKFHHYLMVEVINTGDTISANDALNIFDPYLQVDKNSKKHLLHGLILGTAKRLVEKLKGEIWTEAKNLNDFSLVFVVPVEKELLEEE